jgi:tripartite-type tricarboxylate transporter receptor subunit TctC
MNPTLVRLASCALFAFAAWPLAAGAQAFPSKPFRIVVAFPPGGATDLMARTIAGKLQERTGQPAVVENKPGASGMIGTEFVAKSPPDGYTLVMATQTTHAVNPSLHAKVPYDPVRDFAPVTLAGYTPLALVVPAGAPYATVGEFVAWLKANPGKATFGSGGNGTSQHLSAELFKTVAGVDAVHVPYKGSAPAMADLLGGQVAFMFDNLPTALPHVKSGKLKALAVTSPARSSLAPEVPTMAEAGLPGVETTTWFGLFAPADTPPDAIAKLNAEVVAGLRDADVRARLAAQGIEVVAGTPEAFALTLQREIAKWAKVIRDSGAKPD